MKITIKRNQSHNGLGLLSVSDLCSKRTMKVFGLLLFALFFACSSDNDDEEEEEKPPTFDERILGEWKAEYAKEIYPAVYDETGDSVKILRDDPVITEYLGDFNGHINTTPKCGMFVFDEYGINIISENKIEVEKAGYLNPEVVKCVLEGDSIVWNSNKYKAKYLFKGDTLILELRNTIYNPDEYKISKYTRIKE